MSLREKLPENTQVEVIESGCPLLTPGMRGEIHWNHASARLPTLHSPTNADWRVSVQLLPGRDRVRRVDDDA